MHRLEGTLSLACSCLSCLITPLQAAQHIDTLENQLNEEHNERYLLQTELDQSKQQIVEARQRIVHAEEATQKAQIEKISAIQNSVSERAAHVHAVSAMNGTGSTSASPVKHELVAHPGQPPLPLMNRHLAACHGSSASVRCALPAHPIYLFHGTEDMLP